MKNITSILLFTFLLLTSCQAQQSKNIKTIPAIEYAKKIKKIKNVQLIDVRTPQEYAEFHIKNSKNINWNGATFEEEVKLLEKSKPIYIYCKVGGRSSQAAAKLSELGFIEIYNLEGGIISWNETFPEKN
jgi:rhodanese-related sulfurtransferase